MNVVFVSHCDFTGNSAMHVFSIANRLHELGVESVVCVPHHPESIAGHGQAKFQVMLHGTAAEKGVAFRDGRPPDLVHAWTPRELVRKLTEQLCARYRVPYFVHLEDNEDAIVRDDLNIVSVDALSELPAAMVDMLIAEHRSHPVRHRRFLAAAAGITALMDRLLEFKPDSVPGMVFWPGFDEGFLEVPDRGKRLRANLGIAVREKVLTYTGNVHSSNVQEMSSLVLGVASLRRKGVPIRLVKTGWNYAPVAYCEEGKRDGFVTDLGFVERSVVPQLLAASDVLVQPGGPGEFNDYRFPSKLPEFLVSGKVVVLPKTNIGRFLHDGDDCVLLESGHGLEIAQKVGRILGEPDTARAIGEKGRAFALRELRWDKNVEKIRGFYDEILSRSGISAPHSAPRPLPTIAQESDVDELPVKLIAFYLPQFHRIPENDEWWGKGFTEWTNVTRAKPFFEGHQQPQLPSDLGFYDLKLPDVLDEQATLARSYGIYGFCFYYYWFGGRRLLDRPLEAMLARGRPDFPFCLCWANENWTRRWDGSEDEILVAQEYSDDAAHRFIADVIPILKDPRYIRVKGAPLLLVYRVNLLPDAARWVELWRAQCAEAGIERVHLAAVQSFGFSDPRPFGFDAAVEFPPHTMRWLVDPSTVAGISQEFQGYLEDYVAVARHQLSEAPTPYVRYRGAMPAWDNTPRRMNRAHVLINTSPKAYQAWLEQLVERALVRAPVQEPLVFLNAWNEWAEGAYLEPSVHEGRTRLEATHRALCSGLSRYYRRRGVPVSVEAVAGGLRGLGVTAELTAATADAVGGARPRGDDTVAGPAPGTAVPAVATEPARRKTDVWFDDDSIQRIAERYRTFDIAPLSYATVRDFCDSIDHLNALATANGDLKDCQRPWVLKAIVGRVPQGARIVEIGAGEPIVAEILRRLGYEVWIVDPYDGTGNGPLEYERYRADYPGIHMVRGYFDERTPGLQPGSFDCVYSISVIEHVPADKLVGVLAAHKKLLKRDGHAIHAVDHVHRGRGDVDHLEHLRLLTRGLGLSVEELDVMLGRMSADTETYYLSAESHDRWRGGVPYDEFPMRVCVSVQLCSTAQKLSPGK